jgi:NADPH2:quinone reductase
VSVDIIEISPLYRSQMLMRALVVPRFGAADELRMQDVPVPQPGEHDLLIEVHACGLNPVDFKIRRGAFAKDRKLPIILGFDVSGIVRGMGGSARGFRTGDEVYASPSLVRDGANAEFVCVDARTAAPKPKNLDHVQAAALPLVTLTAWEGLLQRAKLQRGETVLIHAGGGGVGHVAIQLAKHHGARVIATASLEESMALCRRLGADAIVNYRQESFVERVKQETEGRGCGVVFDTVGGDTFARSLDCVAVDGRMITCVGTPSEQIAPKLFRINASLHFEFMGAPTVFGLRQESQGEILRAAAALVDAGELQPHINRVLKLEEVAEGHRLVETGHVTGKLVVRVKQD